MDQHDEQFESFLRQFRLRQPKPLPEVASLRRRAATRWVIAAAAVAIAALTTLWVRSNGTVTAPVATVAETGEPSLYKIGQRIERGAVIQSNSARGLILALSDGSRIELRAQSKLKMESAGDGARVRLTEGSIVVTAARQGAGHLYVQTQDVTVSVVGTVFYVEAEAAGTRVGVVEGEVHVQQGTVLKKLLPGEQVTTAASLRLKSIAETLSWSRIAGSYIALQQIPSPVIAPAPTLAPAPAPAPPPPSEPLQSTRNDSSILAGKQVFDQACTLCHSGTNSMKVVTLGPQFSTYDQSLLAISKAEISTLSAVKSENEATRKRIFDLQWEITSLEKRALAARGFLSDYVSDHPRGFGAVFARADLPPLVDFLFDALTRNLPESIPSDVPLQRQLK